jgi:Uma2 family endonuclease
MMQGIQYPPRTIMEVYKALPEGTLAEIIEGKLYMSPAPNTEHQRLIGDLHTDINLYLRTTTLGKCFVAPTDVFLDEDLNAVQPDIFFVKTGNMIIRHDAIHGVPDVIIECLSPGNSKHDSVTKYELYQKFKVQEYWVVDPMTKHSTGYLLKGGLYTPLENGFGKLKSVLLNHEFTF